MKQTDIQKELLRLFDGMGQSGGIVVWHDAEEEFAEAVTALDLPGIEVMEERENEVFALRRALNEDLVGRRILLYRCRARKLEGDWLADVEARAERFSADYASIQLRELGAPDTPEMRSALRARKAFLAKKTNARRLAALRDGYATPQQLDVGIMACVLGVGSVEPTAVVCSYVARPAEDAASALEALTAAGVRDSFGHAVAAWTGYAADVADHAALRKHVLLTAFSRTAPAGSLDGLSACVSAEHVGPCHDVFAAWAAGDDASELRQAVQAVEAEVGLEPRLAQAGLFELARAEVFPCADAALLRKLFAMASAGADGCDELLEICSRRKGLTWSADFASCYRGVEAAARMLRFYRENAAGMGPMPAERVWKAYTDEWYRMDAWYRELHMAFQDALKSVEYGLDEDFRAACGSIENLYKGWFLRELGERWVNACAADLEAQGYVQGISRQRDFYQDKVDAARAKKRAWVIVSDALRYEVAAELSERLERETKGSCELGSAQSALPSITKCGMSAVLPAGSYALAPREGSRGFSVLVDGEEAVGCAGRQQAIRRTCPKGVAVAFDDFMNEMGRAERKEAVGASDVVYVFHNAIDALGDKQATERKVFQGCEDAVEELTAAVKLVVREFGAAEVLITADHGFLYTDQPLAEPEHASIFEVAGEVVESGRRYAVARAGAASELFLRCALPGKDGLLGFFPRECVRIRMAGGGENYVHGGVSLQEMCVPVLRFSNHRAGSKGYVEAAPATISLVSQTEVISNSLFTLEFLQDEPVGGKVLPCEYDVFVADAGHAPVSDVVRVVAGNASPEASHRITRASFGLRAGFTPSAGAAHLLLAKNAQTGQATVLCELRIQIAFAAPVDFGW